MIKNEVSEFFDISYNEDRTIITMHGMAEHGGVLTKVAMYDDENRLAPMKIGRLTACLWSWMP